MTKAEHMGQSSDAVDSNWSEQRWIKDSTGTVIGIDSRGRQENGGYWRDDIFLDHDATIYRLPPRKRKQRKSFDRIIDSACIVKR